MQERPGPLGSGKSWMSNQFNERESESRTQWDFSGGHGDDNDSVLMDASGAVMADVEAGRQESWRGGSEGRDSADAGLDDNAFFAMITSHSYTTRL